jgi:hypothetical protein
LGHPDFGTTGLFRRLAEPPAAKKMMQQAAGCIIFSGLPKTASFLVMYNTYEPPD